MFADFKQYLENQGRAAQTVQGYLKDLDLFARWFQQTNGEALTPQALTRQDVQQYRQHLQVISGAKPATVNRKLAALRAYTEWAKASGQVEFSAVNGVKNVGEQALAPKWLEKKQQSALLRAVEKNTLAAQTEAGQRQARRDAAVLRLLLNTGLRVAEVCALRLSDVVLRERSAEVRVRAGKGNKQRVIPLNSEARQAVKAWLEVRPTVDTDALFTSKWQEPLQSRGVQFVVAELGRQAGLENVTPHTLRHTFAKNLVDSGVSLEKVAMLLGHSRLDTTLVYTTPGQADLERAVEGLVG